MKANKLFSLTLLSLLLSSSIFGASFTINNKGARTILVRPVYQSGATFDELDPGNSKDYSSGFNNVDRFDWYVGRKDNPKCFRLFSFSHTLGGLNVGGELDIMDDGAYSYRFGVDGSNSGQAQVTN